MDKQQLQNLRESYSSFFKTPLGQQMLDALKNMQETKISEAMRTKDAIDSMNILQNARGVKMVIEYFTAMSAPTVKKEK